MRSPVVIRWGQEMDDNNGQFIWSSWTPEQFINAYRHVVDVCRKQDKSARFMWSVQGDRTVSSYYPGDNYVDIVGVTLFGLQKRDKDEVGRDRSFEEMLEPIYRRVAQFNKPVYVAEFGYEGDDNYVREWARAVSRPYYNMPLLKGVIYFNDREVYPWFNNYGLPNWRVVQDMASGK
jgi:beta-mannanase